MKIEIPKEEAEAIARAIKFPHNEEWYHDNEGILESAIYVWKEATKEQREEWKSGRGFYKEVDPELSDDGWDYIGPFYTYMTGDTIIKNTPARAFGPISKRAIIRSIIEDDDQMADQLSMGVQDAWYELYNYDDLREAYKDGKVTQEFARVMKTYDNDDLAWEAVKSFTNLAIAINIPAYFPLLARKPRV